MTDEQYTSPSRSAVRRTGGMRKLVLWLLTGLLVLVATLFGVLAWAVGTEAGLRALAAVAQRASGGQLAIVEPAGRLLGPLRIEALRYDSADLQVNVTALALDWQPGRLFDRRVVIDHLGAGRVEFAQRGSDAPAATPVPPTSLELPVAVELTRLELGSFELRELGDDESVDSAGEPAAPAPGGAAANGAASDGAKTAVLFGFTDLEAALDSDGAHHRIHRLALTLPQGRAELGGEIAGASPFALSAQGRFDGEQDGRAFALQFSAANTLLQPRLVTDVQGEGLEGHAEIDAAPFDKLPLRALKLAAGELDPAAFVDGAPRAALRLEADLAAPEQAGDGGDALLVGPVRITNRSPAAVDQGGIPLLSFAGRLSWREAEIGMDELDIELPGKGRIGGSLAWRPPVAAEAGIPEAAAQAPAAETGADPVAPGLAEFGQLVAALELAGIDTRKLDTRLPRQIVAGRIDAKADASRQNAVVALAVGKARIEAQAELLAGAGGADAAQAPRRFTLTAALRGVDPRALLADAPSARLNLDLEASGDLPAEGVPNKAKLEFKIPDSRFEELALSGEGRLQLVGERLSDVVLALNVAGNRVDAKGAWGGRGDRLALKLDAPRLAAIGYGLGGRVGAEGTLGGSLAAPFGEVQFFGEALRLPGEITLQGANGQARLDAGAEGAFRIALGLSGLGPAGRDTDGKPLPDWLSNARVSAEGTRAAHQLELSLATPQDDSMQLRLEGGLADTVAASDRLRWSGRLTALESAGRLVTRLLAPASLQLAPDGAALGIAEFSAGERGRVRLSETRWSAAQSVLRGSLTGLSFGLVSRPEGRPQRGPGPLVLGAEWDLRVGETLEGEARLFREEGDLTIEGELPARLGLEHLEAVLAARGDRLALSLGARGTEFGSLNGSATVRAERTADGIWRIAPQAALLGSAQLDMPSITWLGRLMRENVETAGRLSGAFTLAGTVEEPLASGRINGRDLQLALVDQGLILSGGEVVASFDRDRLRLERLAFVSPNRVRPRDNRVPFETLTATPGKLTASGELALDSGVGDFRFAADRLPLLQRADRWMILSGSGTARSTWTSLVLDADFRADAGYLEFAESPPPSLSDDVVVLGRNDQPAGGAFAVSADVRVSLGDALYLSAMGLETRLAGELRLRKQPGVALSAVGTVATVGGTYKGYGQSLGIERGLVNFQGELDNPGLNVVALRKGLEVEAGVEVSGSARRPQVRLTSVPSVPDPEKLSWIVLGRAPDAGSGADLGLLLPAAQALLGGPGGGMTEELSRSIGFDTFSIGQGELNSTSRAASSRVVGGGSTIASGPSVSGQVLSVGKRLGTDLFLSFEQSLGGAETLVKLTYQLSRRVSLIARGGTDNALDLNYSISFR